MIITLKDLFENKIINEEDYYVVKVNNEIVVNNRETIDLRYRDYLDYKVERMYSTCTKVNKDYMIIRISKQED